MELIFEIVEVAFIYQNDSFGLIYPGVYTILLIPLVISITFISLYLCQQDEPNILAWLPEALLSASITNYVLALWIFLYISVTYDLSNVYTQYSFGLQKQMEMTENMTKQELRMLEKGYVV